MADDTPRALHHVPDPGREPLDAARAFGSAVQPGAGREDLATLAAVGFEAATAAARRLAAAAGGVRQAVETKSSATDMVSEVDHQAEAAVAEVLAERRPDDGLLGEEGTSRPGTTGVRWVVDPLDGTTNFLFGVPQYAVSVAAEVDGAAVVGVVIDPSRDETWAAAKGHGAYCNGVRCRVAEGRSTLATALVGTGFAYQPAHRAWQARVATTVLPAVRDLRRFGAAALDLCWLAGGRLDAYYEWGLKPWDVAAGALVAAEAGARVEVGPGPLVVAATPSLHAGLRQLLAGAGGLDGPPEPGA